jgi:hypothetical protein
LWGNGLQYTANQLDEGNHNEKADIIVVYSTNNATQWSAYDESLKKVSSIAGFRHASTTALRKGKEATPTSSQSEQTSLQKLMHGGHTPNTMVMLRCPFNLFSSSAVVAVVVFPKKWRVGAGVTTASIATNRYVPNLHNQ